MEDLILGSSDVSSGIVNNAIFVGAPTTVALVFTSNTPGNIGALLDNVSFTAASVATPEPATLSLLGIGLAGLIARRRRAATSNRARLERTRGTLRNLEPHSQQEGGAFSL